MPQIKYIGKKDFFPDFIAQSGKSWNGYGDVQEVTDDQAKKLLVHDDEFAEQGAHDALLAEQEAAAAAEAARIAAEPAGSPPLAPDQGIQQPAQEVGAPASAGLADAAAIVITADEINAMGKVDLAALAAMHEIAINPAAPVVALRKQIIAALITA